MLLDFLLHPIHCNVCKTRMLPSGKNEWTCPECFNRALWNGSLPTHTNGETYISIAEEEN